MQTTTIFKFFKTFLTSFQTFTNSFSNFSNIGFSQGKKLKGNKQNQKGSLVAMHQICRPQGLQENKIYVRMPRPENVTSSSCLAKPCLQ
jgi:hypothetical protein